MKLASDRKAQDEAVSLERVLSTVENAKKLRLVILDACRNNPFSASMKRSLATRSTVDPGLGRPDPQTAGVMVVYAAAAGQVAEDGAGDHSPFTAALVQRLQEPGLEVSRLFNVVTADVLEATGNHQRPFLYGSNPSREEFYFRLPASVPIPQGPRADDQLDQFWLLLKSSNDVKAIEQFKDRLPSSSPLRIEVEARLRQLNATAAAQVAGRDGRPAAPSPTAGLCGLGDRWREYESGFTAQWRRESADGLFAADYTSPNGSHATTSNRVTLTGSTVSIQRLSSSDGTVCSYTGTLSGTAINGSYSCPRGWAGQRPWSATVMCASTPVGRTSALPRGR